MIRANELMIGDWVRRRYITKPSGQEVVRDFRVTQIRRLFKDAELDVWGDNGNMGTAEQMEPIPLTPEILEKNFEKNTFYGIYDDYYDLDIREYSDGLYIVTYHSCEFNIPDQTIHLSWVHELQHFMRHCGITLNIEV